MTVLLKKKCLRPEDFIRSFEPNLSEYVQQKIEEFLDQGERQILIDFQKLDYICSSGLRSTLISAQKARTAGGKLSCCTLRGVVRKVFDISGFSAMLPIFDSVEDALNTE